MIRWTNTDSYGFFAGLVEQAPVETRDQAALILHHSRLRATRAALRRKDAEALWRVRGALLAIVFVLGVLLVGLLDSPGDYVGPDELAHVRAGHAVAEVTQ